MRSLLLDRDTADRLLAGLVPPDDAPPEYAEVAGLLGSCFRLSLPDRTRERATIDAMIERISSRPAADTPARGWVAARRRVRYKLVPLAIGAMLVGTSGLAFAGELPGPAQRIAHTMFASVGLDIPMPDDPAAPEDVPGGPLTSSVGSGTKGDAISDVATKHAGTGAAHGAAVSSGASDGLSQAGRPHGQSDDPYHQSDHPNGQSDGPHGQSDHPHGQSNGPHGQSDEPHGQPDAGHPT
jgi:hypothetical protein